MLVIVLAALTVFFMSIFHGTAADEPTLEDLGLLPNFYLTNSPYATIESVVAEPDAPGFMIFTVSSPHGVYTVHGLANLRKCFHEIDVLEKLKNDKTPGGGIIAGTVDSLKDTAIGLKNLLVNPVGSVAGVGKGIGKLGGKIGDAFRKKEKGEKGDSYLLSSTKREIAKKLGVDVYSRNRYLQKKLDLMAAARIGGRGMVAIVTFFVPVGTLASSIMTASSVNNAADELVNDNDRGDLYKLNKKALLKLGFPREKVVRFLNHPHYTPRELTNLRFYLEKLREAKNFEVILDAALAADSEVPADKILHEAQIVAEAATDPDLVTMIAPTPEGIVVEMHDKVFLAAAYDCLDISPLSERVEKNVLSFKENPGEKDMEVRNGGSVTSRLGEAFLLKGIAVAEMCLFSPTRPEAQAQQPSPIFEQFSEKELAARPNLNYRVYAYE